MGCEMGSGAVGCGAGARMERRCYPLAMTTPQLITVSEAQQMAREMANSLIADMEAKVTLLQEFAAAMQAELQLIRLGGLQFPPAVPAVPVTAKRMPKDVIADVISTQLSVFTESCKSYHVREFREHCRPFLPLGSADIERDHGNSEKWKSRFVGAHNQIALNRGFTTDGNGNWTVPNGGK